MKSKANKMPPTDDMLFRRVSRKCTEIAGLLDPVEKYARFELRAALDSIAGGNVKLLKDDCQDDENAKEKRAHYNQVTACNLEINKQARSLQSEAHKCIYESESSRSMEEIDAEMTSIYEEVLSVTRKTGTQVRSELDGLQALSKLEF